MAIEKTYSVSKAAKVLGIGRGTLVRWLRLELGLSLPAVGRGSHAMIPESVLQSLMEKKGPKQAGHTSTRVSKVFDEFDRRARTATNHLPPARRRSAAAPEGDKLC